MATVYLMGATYYDVPAVDLPDGGGNTTRFYEAADGDNEGYGSTGAYGTWLFNNTLDLGSTFPMTYYIDFTSNGHTYTQIKFENQFFGQMMNYSADNVYSTMLGWDPNVAYKTIAITGGTDVANPTFMAWLEANATKQ